MSFTIIKKQPCTSPEPMAGRFFRACKATYCLCRIPLGEPCEIMPRAKASHCFRRISQGEPCEIMPAPRLPIVSAVFHWASSAPRCPGGIRNAPALVPTGQPDNSPAFQRRVFAGIGTSPARMAELGRPCGTCNHFTINPVLKRRAIVSRRSATFHTEN